jgi:hypothetical protein
MLKSVKTLFRTLQDQNRAMASTEAPLKSIFQEKYAEFANDLLKTFPELATEVTASLKLSAAEKLSGFTNGILPNCKPGADKAFPFHVLPGVAISQELWSSLSEKSQGAIEEYIRILSFCSLYEAGKDGEFGTEGLPNLKEWTDEFLKTWKEKLSSMDFESMSKKLSGLISSLGVDGLPKLPEKFLKGQLAKLAEELVREFKPEDFDLTPEQLQSADKDPAKAFELLTEIYTKKPEVLQRAIQKIAKRLQEKIRRGELRPEQIAAEAEEAMKEFSSNGAFADLMKSFKDMFGMEDPDLARQAGRPENARMSLVRDRLRKKLDAKKAAKK